MLYNPLFFYIALFFYSVSIFFFLDYIVGKKERCFAYYREWLLVAAIAGVFWVVVRYKEAGHLPLVTLFEITFFYAWMTTVLYLIFVKRVSICKITYTIIMIARR